MSFSRRNHTSRWTLAWIAAIVFGSVHQAQAGTLGTRPYGNYEPLRITYTPDPTVESASQEMTITVSTVMGKPSLVDRELEVVLYISGYYRASTAYRVRITLAEGATSATAKLYYRQPHTYANWLVDAFENNRSIAFPKPVSSYLSANQSSPLVNDCCEIIVPGQAAGTGLPIDYAVNGHNLVNIVLQDAPTDWRVYLRYTFVVWSIENLQVATDQQLRALSSYVMAGGVLVAFYVPSKQLIAMDRLLSPLAKDGQVDFRWQPITQGSTNFGNKRPHGGGQIIGLESAPSDLESIIKTAPLYPVSHFVHDSNIDHDWFWRSLVQTVGKTPVWTFSVLVILFAALVGPGLLTFTNRLRQRTLMLFLVPSISVVLTVLILLYNVLREGFDTRGKICSVQYFDSHIGQGHAWSRQSFFSGAPPAEGLRYSPGCLLNPVDGSAGMNYRMGEPNRRVAAEIVDDGENLHLRNWLAPRSQQQINVGHALNQNSLPIQIASGSNGGVRVTNLTENELPIVVLRGLDSQYFLATSLPAKQTVDLQPQSLSNVEGIVYKEWQDWIPEAPSEIDTTKTFRSRRSRNWYGYETRNFVEPIERILSSRVVVSNLSVYGYLIISPHSSSIDTPFPVEVYEMERNFHILIGTNPW